MHKIVYHAKLDRSVYVCGQGLIPSGSPDKWMNYTCIQNLTTVNRGLINTSIQASNIEPPIIPHPPPPPLTPLITSKP